MTNVVPNCVLCETDGGKLIFRNEHLRVIHCDEVGFPAFYRVVWNAHAAELSDLTAEERAECMNAVVVVEQALREQLCPRKINLAALGNMVPHLHWHVIARFDWDSHFPAPVWAGAQREAPGDKLAAVAQACEAVSQLIATRMALAADD